MSSQLTFDEAQAQAIEKLYMSESVLARRRRALELLALRAGDVFLDLGCGPGFLIIEAAEVVGAAGAVHALDSSGDMLAMAQARAESDPLDMEVQFREGDAQNLPFHDDHFADPAGLVTLIAQEAGTMKLRPDHKLVYRRNWTDPSARVKGIKYLMRKLSDLIVHGQVAP